MAQEYAALAIIQYLEEEERMDAYKLYRRQLRDLANPFEIPKDRFIEVYGVDREMARFLIDILKPYINCGQSARAINTASKVLTALNFYGQGSYQKAVGQDHNSSMSQSSVSRSISDVSNAITNHLARNWVVFPITPQQIANSQQRFYRKFQFPGVIGCIDGSHISIKGPSDEETRMAYYNRKGYFSVNCQIICGADGELLSVNARFPGSVHDAGIWATSDIRATLRQNNRPGVWMLGDSGYPLEPWLLTPYEQTDTDSKVRFNRCHISTRNTVERCLGQLKGRFRCLIKQRELVYKHRLVINIIYACATLHNICLSRNVAMPEHNYGGDLEGEEPVPVDLMNDHLNAGRAVRDDVARRYF